MLPWCDINRAEVEEVGIRIVAVDFEHFGDEASAGPELYLNDHVQRIADVGLDGKVRKLDAGLQDTGGKAREYDSRNLLHEPIALDEDTVGTIDHDLADGFVEDEVFVEGALKCPSHTL